MDHPASFVVFLVITLVSIKSSLGNEEWNLDSCRLSLNGTTYSVESLAAQSVWTSTRDEGSSIVKYYLSVCRPLGVSRLVPTGCDPEGGGCVARAAKSDNVERVIVPNIGFLGNSKLTPLVTDLQLQYSNGSSCGEKSNYSTTFMFLCSENREIEGPRLVLGGTPGCDVVVAWGTPLACRERKPPVDDPCIVELPVSGSYVSLKELDLSGHHSPNTSKYGLSLCKPLKAEWSCGDSSNFCDLDKKNSGRVVNATLRGTFPSFSLQLDLELRMVHGKKKTLLVDLKCARNNKTSPSFQPGSSKDHFILTHPAVCSWREMIVASTGTDAEKCKIRTESGGTIDLNLVFDSFGSKNVPVAGSESEVALNLCRPYEPLIGLDPCNGADSSSLIYGCVRNEVTRKKISLGKSWKASSVNDQHVVVTVSGGSACPNKTGQQVSALVNFTCVADHKEADPEVKQNNCEFQMDWKTAKACPVKKVYGSQCKVTDDVHGWTYDFSSLEKNRKSNQTVYDVKGEVWTPADVKVSLCGPLSEPQECRGAGVCGKTSGLSHYQKWGGSSDKIEFDDGAMSLTYEGGEKTPDCPAGTKSVIIFQCDEDLSGSEGPEFIVFSACTAHLLWRTQLACPPSSGTMSDLISCKFTEGTSQYDLTPLAMLERNYEIPVQRGSPGKGAEYIYINVCSRLAHGKGKSRCPYDSAACLVEEDAETGFLDHTSLGKADVDSAGIIVARNASSVLLVYTQGDICAAKGSGLVYHTIAIEFVCDVNIQVGKPIFVGHPKGDPCSWRLTWKTKAACPVIVKSTTELQGKTPGSDYYPTPYYPMSPAKSSVVARGFGCRVTDPTTKEKYDLTSLGDQVEGKGSGYKFNLKICGGYGSGAGVMNSSAGGECFTGVGACMKSSPNATSKNAGWYSPLVELDSAHQLVLHYIGGDDCDATAVMSGSKRLSTRIVFRCPEKPAMSMKEPKFLGLKDCVFEFEWNTTAACPEKGKEDKLKLAEFEDAAKRGRCMVRTNNTVVDLTSLSSSIGNYHFVSDSYNHLLNASSVSVKGHQPWDYYLAVCRALVPVPGLDCDPSATACRGHMTASSFADAQSLGKFTSPPWVDTDGDVHLTYNGGSKCAGATAPDQLLSTDIVFKCGAGLGMPELIGESPDCKVHLQWRSLTACPPPEPKPATKDCTYVDEQRGLKFKLGTLRKDGYGYFVSERKGYSYVTYMLNVCDHCGGCSDKNAAVCSQSMGKAVSFGRADKAFVLYTDGMLKLRYEGGDECETGEGDKVTEIWFECDRSADDQNAKPEIYETYACLVILKWKTTLVCMDGPTPKIQNESASRKTGGGEVFLTVIAAIACISIAVGCFVTKLSRDRSALSISSSDTSGSSSTGRLRQRAPGSVNGTLGYLLGIFRPLRRFATRSRRGPSRMIVGNYAYTAVDGDEVDRDSVDSYGSSGSTSATVQADGSRQLSATDSAMIRLQDDEDVPPILVGQPDLLVLNSPVREEGSRGHERSAVVANLVTEDDDDDELLQL